MRIAALVLAGFVVAAPAAGQNIFAFQQQLREIDPGSEVVMSTEYVGSGLVHVVITDGWRGLSCLRKLQVAENMRRMWRTHGGTRIVLKDESGNDFAASRSLGGWGLPGC